MLLFLRTPAASAESLLQTLCQLLSEEIRCTHALVRVRFSLAVLCRGPLANRKIVLCAACLAF